jgi:ATP-dependent Lhr-like helicase
LSGPPPGGRDSAAFGLLHEKVRRWIWQQGWDSLRDIQEMAIPALIGGDRDVVLAATTASGKTEAAFLPIVSRLAAEARGAGAGFEAIYVSPLRALINDQFGRIEALCGELDIPVTKWHGDVAASVKARARKRPQGILLTTPESLEAILVRRGPEAGRLFRSLAYVVVDEMHAFLDAPRGRQLQSLLNRVELAAGHRVARVGLSATLADMRSAATFLRPLDPDAVTVLQSAAGHSRLMLQLRGYVEPLRPSGPSARPVPDEDAGEAPGVADAAITRHLFETLKGRRGLVFAGSRRRVELVAAGLAEMTEAVGAPEEFFAHHGSLSREFREEAERRMKDEGRPCSIVCTTTLELGIDIGHVEAIAQLGPGHTVSGMRQRLGRSGRREGQPAVMRVYVTETALGAHPHPLDALRCDTVQAAAMIRLMLRRYNEPPVPGRLDLSTLVQQVLALVAQHGGVTARQAHARLVGSGVFRDVGMPLFATVLRRMGHPDVGLLEQAPDGTLLPGPQGERVIAGRDFYAVFMTPEEYKVVTDRGRSLGTVPVDNPYLPEQLLILGGRRWKVVEVDGGRREILVTRAYGGKPPTFGGDPAPPSDEVVAEMLRVYLGDDLPGWMDPAATGLLAEARDGFRRAGLDRLPACRHEDQLLIFPWTGARRQSALVLSLTAAGIPATGMGLAVALPLSSGPALGRALAAVAGAPAPDGAALARLVPDLARAKYDGYLGPDLLAACYASENIDTAALPALAADLAAKLANAPVLREG